MKTIPKWTTGLGLAAVVLAMTIPSQSAQAQTVTTLVSFHAKLGFSPNGLVQATNGDFYGTAFDGGSGKGGTVFRMTPSGTLTTLYSFCSVPGQTDCTDGYQPLFGVIQASDGNLYGTTSSDGTHVDNTGKGGTIFRITPAGTFTSLYSFCAQTNCTDGTGPGALMQGTNGYIYGIAGGGAKDHGQIFQLSPGLRPFVETQTAAGKVGTPVRILGSTLTGATGVTFNGTAATFRVVSGYEIVATIPTDATTGFVEVATPGGTLQSNSEFTVKP
jgi:uncharacterized repeat protein (TIGR03803 family)